MTTVVSKETALHHYHWGEGCEGWNFVAGEALSIKQEKMPAGTAEQLHYHNYAQQFFFILSGKARFELEDEVIEVSTGKGLHIKPGKKHRIINSTGEDLEFILCSQPSTENDRVNCYDE
jgi:mannose-6-phosphate isomerase-like protein (cupin superfamily)